MYGLIFPNNKIYVGQTKNFRTRQYHHKNAKEFHSNKRLDNAIQKYGWENIQKEILLECEAEYVDFFERAFISGYNSTNQLFGYNLESGGNKNKTLSDETKKKIGLSNTGNTHTEESKKKMRNAKLGKKQTKEHIEKRRILRMGHSPTYYKSINAYDKNGIFIGYFNTLTDASRALNISISNISRVLRGKYKYKCKYAFEYKENSNVKT